MSTSHGKVYLLHWPVKPLLSDDKRGCQLALTIRISRINNQDFVPV